MTPTPRNAVAFVRVSTTQQATEGISVEDQAARLPAYAAAQGLVLVDTILDEGPTSGGKRRGSSAKRPLEQRPGGRRLLELVATGNVQHVLVTKLDRLFRNAADALVTVADWDRRGIRLHLLDMGGQSLDTGSAIGRMFLTMLAGFAEFERNLISERTKAALAHLRGTGQVYGPVPLGKKRRGRALIEDQAGGEAVARIRELRAAGLGPRRIAATLTEAGVPTARGRCWHPSTVQKILKATS